ncbi:unnamed protein product [Cuscuta epithymum]|uniref:Uncharacterized protein n=1 Tax=Cuscuta epithymum TaxID=186058 RepID=A0AAV0FA84_9ASTE|nr:unnamed protein product [Cuscuta epithymum]
MHHETWSLTRPNLKNENRRRGRGCRRRRRFKIGEEEEDVGEEDNSKSDFEVARRWPSHVIVTRHSSLAAGRTPFAGRRTLLAMEIVVTLEIDGLLAEDFRRCSIDGKKGAPDD